MELNYPGNIDQFPPKAFNLGKLSHVLSRNIPNQHAVLVAKKDIGARSKGIRHNARLTLDGYALPLIAQGLSRGNWCHGRSRGSIIKQGEAKSDEGQDFHLGAPLISVLTHND